MWGILWIGVVPTQPFLMLEEMFKSEIRMKNENEQSRRNVCVITKKLLWMPARAREGFNSSDAQPSLDG